eukprot:7252663-Prymnesium_polylepis.1
MPPKQEHLEQLYVQKNADRMSALSVAASEETIFWANAWDTHFRQRGAAEVRDFLHALCGAAR